MKTFLMKFWRDEEGLTIVEYAVAGALISAAAAIAFDTLGDSVVTVIEDIDGYLTP